MKNKYWILIFGAVFALCLALALLPAGSSPAAQAEVVSEGKLVQIADLNIDQEFTVETSRGANTIRVKDGKIAVISADCPDQYCVRQGFCNQGEQIVCLPHNLVISFVGESEIDGAVG